MDLCFPDGHFALLVFMYFALPIKLSLTQPTSFVTFTILILSLFWAAVSAFCWLGLNQSILILFCIQGFLDMFFSFFSENPWKHHTVNNQLVFSSFYFHICLLMVNFFFTFPLKTRLSLVISKCMQLLFACRGLTIIWRHAYNYTHGNQLPTISYHFHQIAKAFEAFQFIWLNGNRA